MLFSSISRDSSQLWFYSLNVVVVTVKLIVSGENYPKLTRSVCSLDVTVLVLDDTHVVLTVNYELVLTLMRGCDNSATLVSKHAVTYSLIMAITL